METIEIRHLGEFARRRRSLSVRHSETGLRRGLEYGERVLVLSDGDYRNAVVNGIEFDLDDTHYQLVLGGRVPADLARQRLDGDVADADVHDVVDMLGMALALAGPGASVTAQRGRRLARR